MARRKLMWVAGVLAVVAAAVAGPARGDTFDKQTIFTFNRPISLPGVTLPAGDYLFRIVDTTTSRKVIQVLSSDGKTPYAMLHSIPDRRLEASDKAEVRFMETAKGQPSAVKAWWYPNEQIGYEFIYPKDQARKLAQETHQPVLTTKVETKTVEETKVTELARIAPTGEEVAVPAVPEPEPVVAAPIPQPPAVAETRTELPVTATPIPTFGFIGLLALALAAGLQAWRWARA